MNMLRNDDMLSDAEVELARIDLAASFRWFARLGMHEAVSNHLSVAVSRDGSPIKPGKIDRVSASPRWCVMTSEKTSRKSVVIARSRPSYRCSRARPGQRP